MSSSTPAKRFKSSNLNNFVVRTSNDQKDAIDKQVAWFFFSSNMSFNSVENCEFQKLCSILRPGYVHQAERNWVEIY